VNHIALEYVRKGDKEVHTNSIENFWSLFKRGVIGQYHQISVKHMHRYLDELTFRFNNRESANLFGRHGQPRHTPRDRVQEAYREGFWVGVFSGFGFAIVFAVSGLAASRRFSKLSNCSLGTFML
jgi:hypothetical protein